MDTIRASRLAFAFVAALSLWRLAILALDAPNLSFDEAQYWDWARTVQLGYYSKPPMVAWAIAATTAACGEGEGCVKLSAALAHMGIAALLFLIGRRLWDARTGAVAAVLWAAMPAVSLSSMVITTDPFLLLFWALALLCLVAAKDGGPGSGRWWAGLGVAFGLGLLSKYAMAFFLLGLAAWMAVDRPARTLLARPGLWAGLGLGVVLYLPNAVWNAANGFVSYAHTRDNAALAGGLFHPDKLLEFVGGQIAVAGPIAFVALILAVVQALGPGAESRMRLLAGFTVPVLAIMAAEALLSRANANWTAPAYVSGTLLAAHWLRGHSRVWLAATLGLHVSAMAAIYHFDGLRALTGLDIGRLDPLRRVRGWDLVGERVSAELAAHPGARLLADERKVLASLTYYVHPHPFDAVKWNPSGAVRDHFDQTSRLEAGEPLMLYVTENPEPPDVLDNFQGAHFLGEIRVHIDAGARGRPLKLWLLSGFKGY